MSDPQSSPEAKAGMVRLTIAVAIAFAILVGFGTWQLQRKAWKEGLLAQIAARSKLDPPLDVERAAGGLASGQDLEYARVRAAGRFLYDRSLFYFTSGKQGPGVDVYTPLVTASGRAILVNRGFISETERSAVLQPPPGPPSEVVVIGLLRKPGTKATFTPANDPQRNLWFWRDLPAMAKQALPPGQAIFPFYIDELAHGAQAARTPGVPMGGATLIELPNRHLEYALTWYGLAASLIAVYSALLAARRRRRRD